jgi:hypothetical protein
MRRHAERFKVTYWNSVDGLERERERVDINSAMRGPFDTIIEPWDSRI